MLAKQSNEKHTLMSEQDILLSNICLISLSETVNSDDFFKLCEVLCELQVLFNFIDDHLLMFLSHKKRHFVKET